MAARHFDNGIDSSEMDDYVPAVFARTPDEAEEYCQVLEDHDIPAVVDEEYQPPKKGRKVSQGVAVLVPESLVEDARAFIIELAELEELADDDVDVDDEEEEEDEATLVADDEDDLEEDLDEEEEEIKKEDGEKDSDR